MSNPNVVYSSFDSRYATQVQLASKANASTLAVGTITGSTTLPSATYSIATLLTTSATTATITLPNAISGQTFDLYITNPASGTVNIPTFVPASSQTLVWTSPLSWVNALSGVNVISFECATAGIWQAYPLTSGLGSSAPLQEQILNVSSAGTAQTISSPLASPFYTINRYVLSANLILTMPPLSINGGESFSLWVDQPSNGSYSVTFSGSIRWVGGSSPAAPGSAQRLWCSFLADSSTGQWIGMTVSSAF